MAGSGCSQSESSKRCASTPCLEQASNKLCRYGPASRRNLLLPLMIICAVGFTSAASARNMSRPAGRPKAKSQGFLKPRASFRLDCVKLLYVCDGPRPHVRRVRQ
eukprot:1999880-Rhodomonas_salina.2